MAEAELHDAVAENDRVLLTAVTVDGVDHPGNVLLGHLLVADVEGDIDVARQQFTDDHAARCGLVDLRSRIAVRVNALEASLDLGVQGDDLAFERMVEFAHV
jgi:hypothetical protein